MRSIRSKIGSAILLCVIAAVMLVGIVSIRSSNRVMEKDSAQLLELMCRRQAETINAQLSRIEQSVKTLSDYAAAHLTDLSAFRTDKEYVRRYSSEMEDIALNAANNTEGAMTVYLRYNPEYTEPTSGVFYSRESADSSFRKLVPTDFSMYEPSDTAHVGWYYIPVQNKAATWLSPYLNENINVEMISYVIPLIIDGETVGIAGMDIDFRVLQDIVSGAEAYTSGYAFLTDGAGNVMVHPDFELNTPLASVNNGELEGLARTLEEESSGGRLESYEMGGKNYKMAFVTLDNGMRLAMTAPEKEIFYEADRLIGRIAVIIVIAVLAAVLISVFVIRGIVKPLGELNDAAKKIAEGELDVTLTCHTRDEVGALADSFRRTVGRLHTYITYIDEINEVLRQIAAGNLAFDLKQQYEGDFARLKDSLLMISRTLSDSLSQIRDASERVSSGAAQVADSAQNLSTGSMTQSASVEELSGLMDEMLSQSRVNADSAQEADQLSAKAGEGLAESSVQMKTMGEAMGQISHSARAITQIVKAISDIAMQTNILALNASTEAARAGEAGKGFSIVAAEVKALAAKSQEAAKNIEDLVSEAVRAIENGSRIAAELQQYMDGAVSGARQVSGIVRKISQSSQSQEQAVHDIRDSVEQISGVVQQNSAASEEEAAASGELSAQARTLRELVARFKLAGNAGDGYADR